MEEGLRLVQLQHPGEGRKVALVEGDRLRLLKEIVSIYAGAVGALAVGSSLSEMIASHTSENLLDYEEIYMGRSEWRLLPSFDHPDDLARCLVTGTGLTHRKSADNRQAMHQANKEVVPEITDSMRMYRWGEEGGRPEPGQVGAQPEWFYKGTGDILKPHNAPLTVPVYSEDGGEEPEIAVAYLIDQGGEPWRIGFTIGNEFSDHQMEQRNYLYLAHSKLRECAIGPELLIAPTIDTVRGTVRIERGGRTLWSQAIASGVGNMVHSLENLEYHHFKYPAHRRPGDVHIHFLGTAGFSFAAGVRLQTADVMEIAFEGLGMPLRNRIVCEEASLSLIPIRSLA